MKHLFITTFMLIALGSSLLPSVALADEYGIQATVDAVNQADQGVPRSTLPQRIAGENDIPHIIGKIVSIGLELVGVVFFLLTLYAGITWMIAMGKSEDVTRAKDILEAALIGLVLVLAAYAITSFVFGALQNGTVNSSSGGTAGAGGTTPAGQTQCAIAYPDKNPKCENYKDPDCTGSRKSISNTDAGQILCPGDNPDIQCCINK